MQIVVADDEQLALEDLVMTLKKFFVNEKINSFRKTSELLNFISENPSSMAFLDMEMRGMNGIELAKHIKDICPNTRITFVTGYSSFISKSDSNTHYGYVLKPASVEDISNEFKHIFEFSPISTENNFIQTFNTFEFYHLGKAITFDNPKVKELLALFVNNYNKVVSFESIAKTLWQTDKLGFSMKSQIKNTAKQLNEFLKSNSIENQLVKEKNTYHLDFSGITVDCIEFIKGNVKYINAYNGKFMPEYEWSDFPIKNIYQ